MPLLFFLVAGCRRPEPARPVTYDELNSRTVLGVRFGMTRAALKARMKAAGLELDMMASDMSRPAEALVYPRALEERLNPGLVRVRYVLVAGSVPPDSGGWGVGSGEWRVGRGESGVGSSEPPDSELTPPRPPAWELSGVELEYPPDAYAWLKARLIRRWGEGIDQGPAGHRWMGSAATASLMPAAMREHCTLVINRRFRIKYKPAPLK